MPDHFIEPSESVSSPAPVRWSPLTRFSFRFAFCYFLLYALGCGNATLWEVIPFHWGEHLEEWTAWPSQQAAQWVGRHLFHLKGVAGTLHGGGSGDRALDWIAVGVMLAIAIIATAIWTAIAEARSRKALAYPRLYFWFRLIIRLTLGYAMLSYGSVKLFPLQMAPPSLAVLNEPLGNTSPMGMLWTLIGLSPVYEMICGAAEMAAGTLILFRRTALLGTLLTVFLTTNIVLYNFCFDVPVKIYAAHLLLMALVMLLPWTPALVNFFFLHRPCAPAGGWTSPARRYGLRIETVATAVVLVVTLAMASWELGHAVAEQHASERHPGPFVGQWHVESATLNGKPSAYLTGDGLPLADIFSEPSGRANFRDTSGVLWRGGFRFDDKKHTFSLGSVGHEGNGVYAASQPDPSHLVLTPTDKAAKTEAVLTLVRVPLPSHYPLLERGFHLVNEWGLER